MSEVISIQKMASRCEALIDTKDVTKWESYFLYNVGTLKKGNDLSDKQLEVLTRIYNKHFAG